MGEKRVNHEDVAKGRSAGSTINNQGKKRKISMKKTDSCRASETGDPKGETGERRKKGGKSYTGRPSRKTREIKLGTKLGGQSTIKKAGRDGAGPLGMVRQLGRKENRNLKEGKRKGENRWGKNVTDWRQGECLSTILNRYVKREKKCPDLMALRKHLQPVMRETI